MRTAKRGPKQVSVLNPLRETWCLSSRTQACVFTCICMLCKRTHTGALENQKSVLSAFLSHSPPYILRRSLSLNLEFTLGLTDQWVPGICLSLTPQHGVYKHTPPQQAFYVGSEVSNSDPSMWAARNLPIKLLPESLPFLIFFFSFRCSSFLI